MELLQRVFQSVALGVPVAIVLALLIKVIGSWQTSLRKEGRPVTRVK